MKTIKRGGGNQALWRTRYDVKNPEREAERRAKLFNQAEKTANKCSDDYYAPDGDMYMYLDEYPDTKDVITMIFDMLQNGCKHKAGLLKYELDKTYPELIKKHNDMLMKKMADLLAENPDVYELVGDFNFVFDKDPRRNQGGRRKSRKNKKSRRKRN